MSREGYWGIALPPDETKTRRADLWDLPLPLQPYIAEFRADRVACSSRAPSSRSGGIVSRPFSE